ncbi:hypothetical protein FJR48_08325 [Sulfurimonas lithotrophica]|uniref:NarX-like N-terminal domain-containing protein n=1 Tax=Sulfurimonas lithotrophica TaxID=2590022 RepID=A0A5P8P2A4_9BACT|nr:type IV pili methyl-accepting chemotaxis transducer N-terminal domain-containing protein [Sulfurimonas lithotrophica]QFR49737.1 hypothetical protein FJR48_08325 [Sulfurimonas lithotrophica]
MAKKTKISTKIKVLGALLMFLVAAIVSTTIFLNNQTSKDALVVNIVGKQRMLTQKMAKNIFYIHYTGSKDFYELNSAVDEFIEGLSTLQHGDKSRGISGVPTLKISNQLFEVKKLWEKYYEDIQNFKILSTNPKSAVSDTELNAIVLHIYKTNPILLENVDKLVTFYTNNSEDKINNIKITQYVFLFIFVLILIYSLLQLRLIESHVDSFMNYYKKLISGGDISNLEPMHFEDENEEEIVEVSQTINCFIEKINSAMAYSDEASKKLENLTEEFDSIIDAMGESSLNSNEFYDSEDMMIESSEELINATRKLQKLKSELEKLTLACRPNIN